MAEQHTIAATSRLAKPMYLLARLVASSAAFQAAVGASDATGALAHVYWPFADDTLHGRPRAIITWGPNWSYSEKARQEWNDSGLLSLSFELAPATTNEDNVKDEIHTLCNTVGTILDQMVAKTGLDLPEGGGTYLTARNFELAQQGKIDGIDEEGEWFYGIEFTVSYF